MSEFGGTNIGSLYADVDLDTRGLEAGAVRANAISTKMASALNDLFLRQAERAAEIQRRSNQQLELIELQHQRRIVAIQVAAENEKATPRRRADALADVSVETQRLVQALRAQHAEENRLENEAAQRRLITARTTNAQLNAEDSNRIQSARRMQREADRAEAADKRKTVAEAAAAEARLSRLRTEIQAKDAAEARKFDAGVSALHRQLMAKDAADEKHAVDEQLGYWKRYYAEREQLAREQSAAMAEDARRTAASERSVSNLLAQVRAKDAADQRQLLRDHSSAIAEDARRTAAANARVSALQKELRAKDAAQERADLADQINFARRRNAENNSQQSKDLADQISFASRRSAQLKRQEAADLAEQISFARRRNSQQQAQEKADLAEQISFATRRNAQITAQQRREQHAMERLGGMPGQRQGLLDIAGNASMVAGGVGLGILGVGVGVADTFEGQLNKVRQNAGLTSAEVDELRQHIMQLGREVPLPLSKIADGFKSIHDLGFRGKDAYDLLDRSAKLAVASQGDFGTEAAIVARVMQQFHMQTSDVNKAMAVMQQGIADGHTSWDDYAKSMSTVMGVAGQFRVNFMDMNAIISTLTQTTGSAGLARTQALNLLMRLQNPTAKTRKELDAMPGQLGVDMRKDFSPEGLGSQGGVLKALSDLHTAQLQGHPVTQFIAGMRGGVGASILAGDNFKVLQAEATKLEQVFKTGVNPTLANYTIEAGRAASQGVLLQNAWVQIGETIRTDLLPVIVSVAGYVRDAAAEFSKMPEPVRTTIITLAALTGVTLLVGGGFLKLASGIIEFRSTMKLLAEIPLVATGLEKLAAASTLVGTAFRSGGAIAGVTELTTVLKGGIAAACASATSALSGVVTFMLGPVGVAIAAVVLAVGLLAVAWQKDWGRIQERTADTIQAVKSNLSTTWDNIKGDLRTDIDSMGNSWDEFWSDLQGTADKKGKILRTTVTGNWLKMAYDQKDATDRMGYQIQAFWDNLCEVSKEMGTVFVQIFDVIVHGILDTFSFLGRMGANLIIGIKAYAQGNMNPQYLNTDVGTGGATDIFKGSEDAIAALRAPFKNRFQSGLSEYRSEYDRAHTPQPVDNTPSNRNMNRDHNAPTVEPASSDSGAGKGGKGVEVVDNVGSGLSTVARRGITDTDVVLRIAKDQIKIAKAAMDLHTDANLRKYNGFCQQLQEATLNVADSTAKKLIDRIASAHGSAAERMHALMAHRTELAAHGIDVGTVGELGIQKGDFIYSDRMGYNKRKHRYDGHVMTAVSGKTSALASNAQRDATTAEKEQDRIDGLIDDAREKYYETVQQGWQNQLRDITKKRDELLSEHNPQLTRLALESYNAQYKKIMSEHHKDLLAKAQERESDLSEAQLGMHEAQAQNYTGFQQVTADHRTALGRIRAQGGQAFAAAATKYGPHSDAALAQLAATHAQITAENNKYAAQQLHEQERQNSQRYANYQEDSDTYLRFLRLNQRHYMEWQAEYWQNLQLTREVELQSIQTRLTLQQITPGAAFTALSNTTNGRQGADLEKGLDDVSTGASAIVENMRRGMTAGTTTAAAVRQQLEQIVAFFREAGPLGETYMTEWTRQLQDFDESLSSANEKLKVIGEDQRLTDLGKRLADAKHSADPNDQLKAYADLESYARDAIETSRTSFEDHLITTAQYTAELQKLMDIFAKLGPVGQDEVAKIVKVMDALAKSTAEGNRTANNLFASFGVNLAKAIGGPAADLAEKLQQINATKANALAQLDQTYNALPKEQRDDPKVQAAVATARRNIGQTANVDTTNARDASARAQRNIVDQNEEYYRQQQLISLKSYEAYYAARTAEAAKALAAERNLNSQHYDDLLKTYRDYADKYHRIVEEVTAKQEKQLSPVTRDVESGVDAGLGRLRDGLAKQGVIGKMLGDLLHDTIYDSFKTGFEKSIHDSLFKKNLGGVLSNLGAPGGKKADATDQVAKQISDAAKASSAAATRHMIAATTHQVAAVTHSAAAATHQVAATTGVAASTGLEGASIQLDGAALSLKAGGLGGAAGGVAGATGGVGGAGGLLGLTGPWGIVAGVGLGLLGGLLGGGGGTSSPRAPVVDRPTGNTTIHQDLRGAFLPDHRSIEHLAEMVGSKVREQKAVRNSTK